MNRESVVLREILARVGSLPGVRLWRANTGVTRIDGRIVRFGIPGQADLSGIVRTRNGGIRLEVEVKSATGKQSEDQARWQRIIESHGGVYVLARSVADVLVVLNALDIVAA